MIVNEAIRNARSSLILYAIKMVLQFTVRIVFLQVLTIEYLGLNGLFSNILDVLSLTELGIGPAIVYSLYRPLADGNEKLVGSLMRLFKISYILIGIGILVLGIGLTPWLDFFIKGKPDIPYLDIIYILFVIDTAISYFFSYKRNLLIADQKQYIVNLYLTVGQISLGVGQIWGLLITHSYWSFIGLKIIDTLLENYFISRKAEKVYPFLKLNNSDNKLPTYVTKAIRKNVAAMIFHKIGGIAVFSSSNILISKFIGLSTVGIFSNYYLIITAINNVVGQVFSSLTASIGNLNTTAEMKEKVLAFRIIEFLAAWLSCYICVGIFVLMNPFISLWLCNQYIFTKDIVALMTLNFYLTLMRRPAQVFKDAMGLFWNDRYKPLAEAIINISAGILLVQHIGIAGVLIAMALSTILAPFWVEPYVVTHNGLNYSLKSYFSSVVRYAGITIALSCLINLVLEKLFIEITIFSFAYAFVLCTIVVNTIWALLFWNSDELSIIRSFVVKKLKGNQL